MNNIDIAIGLIFQNLSLCQEIPSIIQRKIYLLQNLGTDLGFHFVFFHKGPYSSYLSDYLNCKLGIISSFDFDDYVLLPMVKDNIRHIQRLEELQVCNKEIWFNLLSSLVYIHKNHASFSINDDKDSVVKKICGFVPEYNKEHCDYAWNLLIQETFI